MVNVVPDCPTPCLTWAPPSFLANRHSQFFSEVTLGISDPLSKYGALPTETGIFKSSYQAFQGLQNILTPAFFLLLFFNVFSS